MSPPAFELDRIEPGVAARLRPALALTPSNLNPANQRAGLAVMMAVAAALGLSTSLTMFRPDLPLGLLAGFMTVLGVSAAAVMRRNEALSNSSKRATALALREAAPRMQLSRVEALYLQSLATLLDASEMVGHTVTTELLEQLNALMANARELQELVVRLETVRGASPETLVAELEGLREKSAAAPDEASRRALEESVALCAARLARQQAVLPDLARVDSQLEVVYQSMATVESALRGMAASRGSSPPELAVEEIRQQTAAALQQTRSVEAAVEEVLTLSRG